MFIFEDKKETRIEYNRFVAIVASQVHCDVLHKSPIKWNYSLRKHKKVAHNEIDIKDCVKKVFSVPVECECRFVYFVIT